jgi:HEAT repeat protein
MKSAKRLTAAELMALLHKNREFIARQADQEQQRKELERSLHAEEEPLVQALAAAGVVVSSVWELVNSAQKYPSAIPVLIKHLKAPYHPKIREGVARALTVPEAKPMAAHTLIEAFQHEPDGTDIGVKWALANALTVVADDSVLDDLIALVQDKRHGASRAMLTLALGNTKNPRAVDVLIGLLQDDEVVEHALTVLGTLRAQPARQHIQRLLHHPQPRVRKAAKQALAKIDRG